MIILKLIRQQTRNHRRAMKSKGQGFSTTCGNNVDNLPRACLILARRRGPHGYCSYEYVSGVWTRLTSDTLVDTEIVLKRNSRVISRFQKRDYCVAR